MDFANMGSMKELIKAGGPVLFILVALSVYSISVMIERFLSYRKNINKSRKLMEYVRYQLPARNFNKIMDACRKNGYSYTPAAKLVLNLVKSDKSDIAQLNDLFLTVIVKFLIFISEEISDLKEPLK